MLAAIDGATATIVVGTIALAGPLLTYLGLRRGKSGRVNATEAETLWAEANTMRTAYRDEASGLRVEGMAMREEVLTLRREVASLRSETSTLRSEAVKWRSQALDLRAEVESSRDEALALSDEVNAGRMDLAAMWAGHIARRADAALRRHERDEGSNPDES